MCVYLRVHVYVYECVCTCVYACMRACLQRVARECQRQCLGIACNTSHQRTTPVRHGLTIKIIVLRVYIRTRAVGRSKHATGSRVR